MPRPSYDQPTPGELEVLKVLWDLGPATVREVMEVLNRDRERAYTSVMSLLNVMTDKGLLRRRPSITRYIGRLRKQGLTESRAQPERGSMIQRIKDLLPVGRKFPIFQR